MEIFKMTSKLGIKPKDVIGMGGDIVKMGKSLFNTKVNPKLLEYVNKKGEVPGKILEDIKVHMRTLKNASDNQIELFRLNLKEIFNAKFPPPVASVKKQATSDNGLAIIHNLARKLETKNQGKIPSRMDSEAQAGSIAAQIQDVTGKTASELNKFIKSEAQLLKILNDWNYGSALTRQKPPMTTSEKVIDFKGWKPTVIEGGKGKVIVKDKKRVKEIMDDMAEFEDFSDGGIAKLNAQLNQLPEYYLPMADGGITRIPFFKGAQADTKKGKAMSPGTSASGGLRHTPSGNGGGPEGPPKVINPPKGPTPEEIEAEKKRKALEEQQRRAREYAKFYSKFKGDTKKKSKYLKRLLANDPLLETYVDKGLLDWENIKSFDKDRFKTKEEIEKAKQSAWGYTRPWDEKDDSLYIRDLDKFDPTWTPGWTGDSKQERLNKRIANTIGHEARHQVLGEGQTPPWGIEGQTLWTGDPYSQKVEIDLTQDENSPYSKFIKEGGLGYEGYTPEITSHELLTRMGDFQSYNNPRVYEDIYENVHGGMPRHLTSNVANELYDASEKFAKDTSARTVAEKYENIDPVMVEGLKNAYPDEDVDQALREMSTRRVMDLLQDDYEYDKKYAKGGIANHFRKK